ncbi:5-deoxy-glucuronate isomerase [Lewinella sp. LCG006]|uniref:5-deoxy-glucuronate isomerase n=1 Tax=Lewinella sp. LCG006 TaxID=3231911 RepID=UPI00345F9F7F
MVQPKTIGRNKIISPQSPKERRHDLQVMVPLKNEIRKVEAFNAIPAPGVQEIITEENSSFQFLRLARILLQEGTASRSLDKAEAVYYVNRGKVSITANGQTHTLGKGDVLYVSVDSEVSLSSDEFCDVSEYKAVACHTKYPDKLVRHTDIEGTELAADLGSQRPMSQRTVFKLVDKNVQANRLLFGDTYMAHRGGVGSYPPHFHGPDGPHGLGANAKEEIYHFRCETEIEGDVPYVLQNCALPEEKVNVYAHIFDEVAINVTPTYHDTIAPPAVDFMFTWCLASFTEGHRDWAEIYNKPGYENEW